MKRTRRSFIAFAAAALLTGAGVAVVANSAASTGSPTGTTSVTEPSPHESATPGTSTAVDDSTGRDVSGRNGADDPATHDLNDDHGTGGHGADG